MEGHEKGNGKMRRKNLHDSREARVRTVLRGCEEEISSMHSRQTILVQKVKYTEEGIGGGGRHDTCL